MGRNVFQMKEQNKTPEKELNNMETIYQMQSSKLGIRLFNELRGMVDEIRT